MPGLALAAAIAAAAMVAQRMSGIAGLSPLILAVVAGIAIANSTGVPKAARPGLAIAMRPVLRFAIVLLGAQLTFVQIGEIGIGGISVVMLTVAATFLFTLKAGALLGVEPALARMIAAGTSICGASAVIATNAVGGGRSDQVATAIACVTLFGTVAMLGYPLVGGLLGLDAHMYGVWTGASVHEVAQAVAAGFAGGPEAGETATVTKLARVLMLAPVLLVVARSIKVPAGAKRPPAVPLFVVGFAAMVVLNSVVSVPAELRQALSLATTFLMAMSLAAVGLATDIRALVSGGVRPFLLGLAAFLFVATFGMMLVTIIM